MGAFFCNSCNMENSFKWCKMIYVDLYIYQVYHIRCFYNKTVFLCFELLIWLHSVATTSLALVKIVE